MTRLLPRALLFAVLAIVVAALLSAIVLLVLVGMPRAGEGTAEFQRAAVARAVEVDLIVGGIVALSAGFLAGRGFSGRDSVLAGALTGLLFILIDLGVVLFARSADQIDWIAMAVSYADKLAAATLGGWLGSRRSREPVATAPDHP